MIFVDTRPVAIDYIEPSDELELDHPSRVILHLWRPNVSIPMDVESMRDPDQVKHKLHQLHHDRYPVNGVCFDRQAQKGRRRDRWGRWLEEAAIGINGAFHTRNGQARSTKQALSELRK